MWGLDGALEAFFFILGMERNTVYENVGSEIFFFSFPCLLSFLNRRLSRPRRSDVDSPFSFEAAASSRGCIGLIT